MRRIVFLLSILFCCVSVVGQVAPENRQARIDALLGEYKKLRGKAPYSRASAKLQDAAFQAAYGGFDNRDDIILRYAQLEYMKRYNITFAEENSERHILQETIQKFDNLPDKKKSYGLSLIYAQLKLYRLPYVLPREAPAELIDILTVLESVSTPSIEPELAMYYALLDMKINEVTRKNLIKSVNKKIADYDGRYWADAALLAHLVNMPSSYVERCLQQTDKTNKPAADAVRAYIKEGLYTLSNYDEQEVYKSYLKPAKKGSVLACIQLTRSLLAQKRNEEAKEVLQSVENEPFFTRYGGSLYKAAFIAMSGELSDLQESLRLYQATMDSCVIRYQRKNAEIMYDQCQTKIAILQLEQQEEMIDFEDVTVAELVAIAKGYEMYKRTEKAITYYRYAAEMGDMHSISKVALYDMKQGVLTQNESMTIDAARTIIENADSWFSPFVYNAFAITLFGLDGNAPNKEKATIYFKEYLKKIEKDALASTYGDDDFLIDTNIVEDEEELEYFIGDSDEVIECYNKGLEYEALGDYENARSCYIGARNNNHPLAKAKLELMEKLIK